MKILFSSYLFHPSVGGIESVSKILAEKFAAAGNDVHVVTQSDGDPRAAVNYSLTRRPSLTKLFRRANHPLSFYFTDVGPSIGIPLLLFAAAGMFFAFRRRRTLDILLLTFTIVPLLFYIFWPVKGFEYILPVLVPLSVLAVKGVLEIAAPAWASEVSHAWPNAASPDGR